MRDTKAPKEVVKPTPKTPETQKAVATPTPKAKKPTPKDKK